MVAKRIHPAPKKWMGFETLVYIRFDRKFYCDIIS